MAASSRWRFSKAQQDLLIDTLTENLPMLRGKAGISQEELASIIGVSRQTYCAFESKKRRMSWQTYLSLSLFFDGNKDTHSVLHYIGAFPESLVERQPEEKDPIREMKGILNEDVLKMLAQLDSQAMHSVKTVLMVEYARCAKVPGETVIKAFDGSTFSAEIMNKDIPLEDAIERIVSRGNGGE